MIEALISIREEIREVETGKVRGRRPPPPAAARPLVCAFRVGLLLCCRCSGGR